MGSASAAASSQDASGTGTSRVLLGSMRSRATTGGDGDGDGHAGGDADADADADGDADALDGLEGDGTAPVAVPSMAGQGVGRPLSVVTEETAPGGGQSASMVSSIVPSSLDDRGSVASMVGLRRDVSSDTGDSGNRGPAVGPRSSASGAAESGEGRATGTGVRAGSDDEAEADAGGQQGEQRDEDVEVVGQHSKSGSQTSRGSSGLLTAHRVSERAGARDVLKHSAHIPGSIRGANSRSSSEHHLGDGRSDDTPS